MKAINYLCITSLFLLSACAPPPQPCVGTVTNETTTPDTLKNEGTVAADGTVTMADGTKTGALVENKATAALTSFELSGAMAVRSNNKGWTASINWLQQGAGAYHIRLFGPLGSGTVLIDKQSGVVTYRDGPKSATSPNADELLMKQTGIRLPVNNLYYWVRGLPAPGAIGGSARDQGNHLSVLKQAGYTIQYLGYTSVNGKDLPSSIRLQGNNVSIKLIIKRWKV